MFRARHRRLLGMRRGGPAAYAPSGETGPVRLGGWVGDNDMWIQLGIVTISILEDAEVNGFVYIYIWFNRFPVFSRVVGYFRWSYVQIVLVILWRSTKIVVSRCRDGEMQPASECQCFALLNGAYKNLRTIGSDISWLISIYLSIYIYILCI